MSIPDGYSEEFNKIKEEYLQSIPEKLHSIEQLINGLKASPSLESVTSLRNIIHKIAGNAGSFGFPEASILCKEWDRKLGLLIEEYSENWVRELLPELDHFHQNLKAALPA